MAWKGLGVEISELLRAQGTGRAGGRAGGTGSLSAGATGASGVVAAQRSGGVQLRRRPFQTSRGSGEGTSRALATSEEG